METKTKTTAFHLIILDESGSMSPLTQQTIDGCNETLNVVRSLQNKYGDTQRNLVSIYLFQSNPEIPSRYVYKNKPIDEVKDMTPDVYRAWGGTPLLDAVGSTLVDLRAVASTHEDSTATVTIITDGMENSSEHYTYEKVAALISELKEIGWTINFIGANIDVDRVAQRMNIDNRMKFESSANGTKDMFTGFASKMMLHEEDRIMDECSAPNATPEEKIAKRKMKAMRFFKR